MLIMNNTSKDFKEIKCFAITEGGMKEQYFILTVF